MKSVQGIIPKEINITDSDRITYLYKRDDKGNIAEVTNVSYEVKIYNKWETVVRYDSSHGFLHRHMRIAINDERDTPSTIGVKRKGTHDHWLTWAIDDIKTRYDQYRTGFLKRSKLKEIDIA